MNKLNVCLLSFLLVFSILAPCFLWAEDLVTLKNLSWEEQKNRTRLIIETSKALVFREVATETSNEILVELENLDLRNLPQELFINTNEVVSLQTYPQSQGQKARIVVKMNGIRPHYVSTEGNKVFIDIEGNPDGDGLLAPVTTTLPPDIRNSPVPRAEEITKPTKREPILPESEPEEKGEPVEMAASEEAGELKGATQIQELKIREESGILEVILIGDGSFDYDVFELANPQRVVIDLKSVSLAPGIKTLYTGGNDIFSRVRVAQYQTAPKKVARAVIDLKQRIPYSVVPSGKELQVRFGEEISQSDEPADSVPSAESIERSDAGTEPVATPVSAPVAEKKMAAVGPAGVPSKTVEPPISNEQFFSFKPDTSLFAQQQETTAQEPETTPETGGGTGMGTFGERTIRGGEKQYTGEPFSFDFKDIDIKDLFRFIADISGLNVILDPAVRGSVTLKLTEVPWDQALDLITKNQGLGYTIEGNVIRIAPLAKIAQEEKARADAEKQQMLNAPLVTKIKRLSYAKAQEVDRVVKRLLTPKGSSIVDQRTNTMIVTDINTNIDSIINLIDTLDSRTAQVIIEARIVETTKNYSQAFGIQWGFRGMVDPAFGNNTTLQFPNNVLVGGDTLSATSGITGNPLGGYAVNLPTNEGPNTALLLSAGNVLDTFRLDMALMALETTGNGRVLSSPKIATQNNTRAEILQGTQIPVQTIANNTITTTFQNAALRMNVTPQITAEGTVIMDVEVENNRPDFTNVVFGTPPIITERATTTLLVEDGGTTVIGGIFTASDEYSQGRTPILHRIPLLGWLFKNSNISRENRELLIFLTPRILR